MKLLRISMPLIMCLLGANHAHANDPFAELEQEINAQTADDSAEFEQWYAEQIKAFNAWQMKYLDKWDDEKAASITAWGDGKTDAEETIVKYQDNTRTVVDLAKNEIIISYHIDNNQSVNINVINDAISNNKHVLNDAGITTPIEPATDNAVIITTVEPDDAELLALKAKIKAQTERQMSQLDIRVGQSHRILSPLHQDQLLREQKTQIKQNETKRLKKIEKQFTVAKKSLKQKPKKVVQYKVKIPKTAVAQRAKVYMPYIEAESRKHQLPAPLVLAIMHTESHFNPKAKSHIPAYGLMQIVPTSAGHDVNKLYRGKDKPMSSRELYDPEVNIETGAMYLSILQKRYLKGIKDPLSAQYSVIAAYNTGAGNVAKAFGTKSVRKAINKINRMTSDQVYQQLITHLPYLETRNYLKKVNKQVKNYQQSAYSKI